MLRRRERLYGKITLFESIYFTCYVINNSILNKGNPPPPPEAPQVSTVVQVAMYATSVLDNIFTEKIQVILDFTSTQFWVLVDDGYDSQELVLYCKFTDVKEWCQLKSKILAICSGVYYGDRKIKCLQALDWWVSYLTLRGKIIDLNKFKTDIISDAIGEYQLDFEDIRYGNGDLSNPK